MTDRVWLAALRRGIAHHTIDGRHTTCRRYIGGARPWSDLDLEGVTPYTNGFVVDYEIAVAGVFPGYATRPCARCYGTADIVTHTVVPSRDRRPA